MGNATSSKICVRAEWGCTPILLCQARLLRYSALIWPTSLFPEHTIASLMHGQYHLQMSAFLPFPQLVKQRPQVVGELQQCYSLNTYQSHRSL